MRSFTIAILILVGFNSVTNGQTKSYLSDDFYKINKLGYVYSEYDNISNGLYDKFYEIFSLAINNNFGVDIKEIKNLNDTLSFELLDTLKIKSLQKENNLDAILITKVYFLSRDFIYKGFLGLDDIYNPKVMQQGPFCFYAEIKVFNNSSQVLLNSSAISLNGHNAKKSLNNAFKKAMKKVKNK